MFQGQEYDLLMGFFDGLHDDGTADQALASSNVARPGRMEDW
jgi:hypothetical protein